MLKRALLLLILLPTLLLAQTNPVKVTAKPQQVQANNPYTEVKIVIERDERNRGLWLLWGTDPEYVQSSFYQINGAQDQRIFYQTIKFREYGDYEIKAALVRNDETSVTDSVYVTVR